MEEMKDTYKTVKAQTEGLYKNKGSKFVAFAYPVVSEAEVKEKISLLKKDHHDARHYVYGFCLAGERGFCRCSDDGEPANSSGPSVLGQIESRELRNVLVVVVRYFGGTKLGVPGLIMAYRGATSDALNKAVVVEEIEKKQCEVRFIYPAMGDVMRVVSEESIGVLEQDFGESCRLRLAVRLRDREKVEKRFADLRNNEFGWF